MADDPSKSALRGNLKMGRKEREETLAKAGMNQHAGEHRMLDANIQKPLW